MGTGVPAPSSSAAASRMRAARRRDTGPELALRRILHRRGLRYRVDAPLAGTRRRADVSFASRRIAVFVDGCFWHSCPQHGTLPKANHEWWTDKLERNVARDRNTDAVLLAARWRVVRVWEHEDMSLAADRIESLVRGTAPE